MSAGEAAGQAQGDGGQAEGQEQQQQGPDVAALSEQLGALTGDMGQLREMLPQLQEFMQSQQTPPAEEQQEEPLNLDFLDTGDPEYNQQLSQGLQALIDQRAQSLVDKRLGEQMSPVMDKLTAYEADRLVDEFPELGEQETAQRVVQFSRQRAEALGRPELANSVDFWRESYLLGRVMQMMQEEQQQAGQESAAHLEGGGGAGAGAAPQVDLGDQIVNGPEGTRLGAKVLPWH